MDQFLSWLAGLAALLLPSAAPAGWTGYVEPDYVHVGAAVPGVVDSVAVAAGEQVPAGAPLFTLRHAQQAALLAAAKARENAAAATLRNMESGRRPEEIAVIRASLERAAADLALARASVARSEGLAAEGVATKAQLDRDRASLASAEAQMQQLQAELAVAELPARAAEQQAAEANLAAARAEVERARAELAQYSVAAPVAGRVDRVFFRSGEAVEAGRPVVALLPEGGLRVKFYVGEPDRLQLALGDSVAVACTACPEGLAATISRLAAEPQFTPPVIFSREERHRLTFLVEAVLAPGTDLPPGQPVTVRALP